MNLYLITRKISFFLFYAILATEALIELNLYNTVRNIVKWCAYIFMIIDALGIIKNNIKSQ